MNFFVLKELNWKDCLHPRGHGTRAVWFEAEVHGYRYTIRDNGTSDKGFIWHFTSKKLGQGESHNVASIEEAQLAAQKHLGNQLSDLIEPVDFNKLMIKFYNLIAND